MIKFRLVVGAKTHIILLSTFKAYFDFCLFLILKSPMALASEPCRCFSLPLLLLLSKPSSLPYRLVPIWAYPLIYGSFTSNIASSNEVGQKDSEV